MVHRTSTVLNMGLLSTREVLRIPCVSGMAGDHLYYHQVELPYSWKFSRDKNFEVFADFDLSAKIKTSKLF